MINGLLCEIQVCQCELAACMRLESTVVYSIRENLETGFVPLKQIWPPQQRCISTQIGKHLRKPFNLYSISSIVSLFAGTERVLNCFSFAVLYNTLRADARYIEDVCAQVTL